jgi:hypothetical protein
MRHISSWHEHITRKRVASQTIDDRLCILCELPPSPPPPPLNIVHAQFTLRTPSLRRPHQACFALIQHLLAMHTYSLESKLSLGDHGAGVQVLFTGVSHTNKVKVKVNVKGQGQSCRESRS